MADPFDCGGRPGSRAYDDWAKSRGVDTNSGMFHVGSAAAETTANVVLLLATAGESGAARAGTTAISETASVAKGTAGELEVFYRTMSAEDHAVLLRTGSLPATGETSITTCLGYALKYDGTIVQLLAEQGTLEKLLSIGSRDQSKMVREMFPALEEAPKGWGLTMARFQSDGGNLAIGLGKGEALTLFNSRLVGYMLVRK